MSNRQHRTSKTFATFHCAGTLLLILGFSGRADPLYSQGAGSAPLEAPPPMTEPGADPIAEPMSLSLPEGDLSKAAIRRPSLDEDSAKLLSPQPAPVTPGYTTILFEDAEGSFPSGNGWNVFDSNAASGNDYWDDLSCRSYRGSWSVWSADIGDQIDCVNYDNDMQSWMIFGPFDLSDASAARAEFRVWSETERPDIPFDYFFWGASSNGTDFSGFRLTANTTWSLGQLDFTNVPTLGNLTGDSTVWFAFAFFSDSTVNGFEGTYVDDILIEKLVSNQVDLVATEVFFRDQPGNAGNIIDNPTENDTLYPHFRYTVNSQTDVSGKIWEISINNSFLCSSTFTVPPGARVGWCNSPISLLPGLHSLHGQLDPDRVITETNENNNDSFHNYDVAGAPGTFTLSNEPPVCDTGAPGPSPAVRLNWTTSSEATSYDVYRNGSFYAGGITGNTFYNSANVFAGQTYTYFIRAHNSSGTRDSNAITVVIPSDICAPDIRVTPLRLDFDSQAAVQSSSATESDRILLKNRTLIPDPATPNVAGGLPEARHLLIQFDGEPSSDTLAILEDLRVAILHWVPNAAVLAHVPAHTDLSSIPGIRWSGLLQPTDKMDSRLQDVTEPIFAMVDFFPDIHEAQALAILEDAGGEAIPGRSYPTSSYLTRGDGGFLKNLSRFDEVSWIRAASEAEISGEELFYCPGAQTSFGTVPNFVAHDDGWDGPGQGSAHDLLYHFVTGTADISGSLENAEVARAFTEWTRHAAVTYTETGLTGQSRSMDVSWATGSHGDNSPFDGPGGDLAHNFYPSPPNSEPIAGDMHFDDAETWRIGSGTGFDVFTIALHEAGHGLGLAHSDDSAAVMYPSISSSTVFTGLHADDISGIQTIYATAAAGSQSFTIFNDGFESLSVSSVSLDAPASWISWSPAAPFTVAGGGSQLVTVSVNFGLAPPGQSTRRLLIVSNDPDESPYPGGVDIVVTTPACYMLTLSHSGSGSNPLAAPSASSGCPSGSYHAGESITLTASPSSGWQVTGWSGTSNDASTSTSNSLVMPASPHAVSVSYSEIPAPCYTLTSSHTGSGNDPAATPSNSSGCVSGQYHAGEIVSLMASPSIGWRVGSWSGTSNDLSTSTSNSLTMPSGFHAAAVNYLENSGLPLDLVLSNDTLPVPQVYEACRSITLGPNLVITAGGAGVTFRAPRIVSVSGVSVPSGAVATFDGSKPTGCP